MRVWLILLLVGCTAEPMTNRDAIERQAEAFCEFYVRCHGGDVDRCARAIVEQYCVHTPCDAPFSLEGKLELCEAAFEARACDAYGYPEVCP